MVFSEYKENVKRTCPDLGSFRDNNVILNSIHMVLGMNSEIYELNGATDKVNMAEEITDELWYACNYANFRGIIIPENFHITSKEEPQLPANVIFEQFEMAQGNYVNALSELQDYDKKEFAYNKSYGEDIQKRRTELLLVCLNALDDMYRLNGIDAERAMQNNIDKLRARYPEKFDEQRAVNRDLDVERKELEK